jgi:hypothetical protein
MSPKYSSDKEFDGFFQIKDDGGTGVIDVHQYHQGKVTG